MIGSLSVVGFAHDPKENENSNKIFEGALLHTNDFEKFLFQFFQTINYCFCFEIKVEHKIKKIFTINLSSYLFYVNLSSSISREF